MNNTQIEVWIELFKAFMIGFLSRAPLVGAASFVLYKLGREFLGYSVTVGTTTLAIVFMLCLTSWVAQNKMLQDVRMFMQTMRNLLLEMEEEEHTYYSDSNDSLREASYYETTKETKEKTTEEETEKEAEKREEK